MGEGNIFSLFTSVGEVPRPRSGRGGTPSHLWTGGYPIPGLDGGVPHPVLDGGIPHSRSGGVPHPRSGRGGTPSSFGWGGTPSQVWTGGYPIPGLEEGGTQGTPPARSKIRMRGVPRVPPIQDWMGYPPSQVQDQDGGVPPTSKTGWGTPSPPARSKIRTGGTPPRPRLDGVPPPTHQESEQHSEYSLHGGRYASCVHAGGLSCWLNI